jgi:hypothetical protein
MLREKLSEQQAPRATLENFIELSHICIARQNHLILNNHLPEETSMVPTGIDKKVIADRIAAENAKNITILTHPRHFAIKRTIFKSRNAKVSRKIVSYCKI